MWEHRSRDIIAPSCRCGHCMLLPYTQDQYIILSPAQMCSSEVDKIMLLTFVTG